jgi:hypothetical protein
VKGAKYSTADRRILDGEELLQREANVKCSSVVAPLSTSLLELKTRIFLP